jgi:hypothetical protein
MSTQKAKQWAKKVTHRKKKRGLNKAKSIT